MSDLVKHAVMRWLLPEAVSPTTVMLTGCGCGDGDATDSPVTALTAAAAVTRTPTSTPTQMPTPIASTSQRSWIPGWNLGRGRWSGRMKLMLGSSPADLPLPSTLAVG